MNKCQLKNCDNKAIECRFVNADGHEVFEYLCTDHAPYLGYCMICGEFWGGIESFDFLHPGVCDHCHDELAELDTDEDY